MYRNALCFTNRCRRTRSHVHSSRVAEFSGICIDKFHHILMKGSSKSTEPNALVKGKQRGSRQGTTKTLQDCWLGAFNHLVTRVNLSSINVFCNRKYIAPRRREIETVATIWTVRTWSISVIEIRCHVERTYLNVPSKDMPAKSPLQQTTSTNPR